MTVELGDAAMQPGKRGFERTAAALAALEMDVVFAYTPAGAAVPQRHPLLDALPGVLVMPLDAREASVRARVSSGGLGAHARACSVDCSSRACWLP